jgi:hypothetical protein
MHGFDMCNQVQEMGRGKEMHHPHQLKLFLQMTHQLKVD